MSKESDWQRRFFSEDQWRDVREHSQPATLFDEDVDELTPRRRGGDRFDRILCSGMWAVAIVFTAVFWGVVVESCVGWVRG